MNNSLAWFCHGVHELPNDAFDERFGVPRSAFVELLRRVGSLDDEHKSLVLTTDEAELIGRCLDEMLDGPAALLGAGRGTPDWLLVGNSEEEFKTVQAEWCELLAGT